MFNVLHPADEEATKTINRTLNELGLHHRQEIRAYFSNFKILGI